jgi:hypothetical protein
LRARARIVAGAVPIAVPPVHAREDEPELASGSRHELTREVVDRPAIDGADTSDDE